MDDLCVLSEKPVWNLKNDCTTCVESTSSRQLFVVTSLAIERLVVYQGYKSWL